MKALKLISFLSLIFFVILACEDVFELNDNSLVTDPPVSDSIPTTPCDTCNVTPPDDSIPSTDTISTFPDDIGPNCDSVGGLWICGIDDSSYFDYDLLTGLWWLKTQTTYPNDTSPQVENYGNDSAMYNLSLKANGTFVEVFDGVVAEGTWESFIELNNQIWLTTTDDVVFKYYIIALTFDEMRKVNVLEIARLDYNQPAIIDRIYERN